MQVKIASDSLASVNSFATFLCLQITELTTGVPVFFVLNKIRNLTEWLSTN